MSVINNLITRVFNPFIWLLFGAAVAVFFWGIIEFILNADNEEKRTDGKRHIFWGLIGLLIMTTIRGIIEIIRNFVQFR